MVAQVKQVILRKNYAIFLVLFYKNAKLLDKKDKETLTILKFEEFL